MKDLLKRNSLPEESFGFQTDSDGDSTGSDYRNLFFPTTSGKVSVSTAKKTFPERHFPKIDADKAKTILLKALDLGQQNPFILGQDEKGNLNLFVLDMTPAKKTEVTKITSFNRSNEDQLLSAIFNSEHSYSDHVQFTRTNQTAVKLGRNALSTLENECSIVQTRTEAEQLLKNSTDRDPYLIRFSTRENKFVLSYKKAENQQGATYQHQVLNGSSIADYQTLLQSETPNSSLVISTSRTTYTTIPLGTNIARPRSQTPSTKSNTASHRSDQSEIVHQLDRRRPSTQLSADSINYLEKVKYPKLTKAGASSKLSDQPEGSYLFRSSSDGTYKVAYKMGSQCLEATIDKDEIVTAFKTPNAEGIITVELNNRFVILEPAKMVVEERFGFDDDDSPIGSADFAPEASDANEDNARILTKEQHKFVSQNKFSSLSENAAREKLKDAAVSSYLFRHSPSKSAFIVTYKVIESTDKRKVPVIKESVLTKDNIAPFMQGQSRFFPKLDGKTVALDSIHWIKPEETFDGFEDGLSEESTDNLDEICFDNIDLSAAIEKLPTPGQYLIFKDDEGYHLVVNDLRNGHKKVLLSEDLDVELLLKKESPTLHINGVDLSFTPNMLISPDEKRLGLGDDDFSTTSDIADWTTFINDDSLEFLSSKYSDLTEKDATETLNSKDTGSFLIYFDEENNIYTLVVKNSDGIGKYQITTDDDVDNIQNALETSGDSLRFVIDGQLANIKTGGFIQILEDFSDLPVANVEGINGPINLSHALEQLHSPTESGLAGSETSDIIQAHIEKNNLHSQIVVGYSKEQAMEALSKIRKPGTYPYIILNELTSTKYQLIYFKEGDSTPSVVTPTALEFHQAITAQGARAVLEGEIENLNAPQENKVSLKQLQESFPELHILDTRPKTLHDAIKTHPDNQGIFSVSYDPALPNSIIFVCPDASLTKGVIGVPYLVDTPKNRNDFKHAIYDKLCKGEEVSIEGGIGGVMHTYTLKNNVKGKASQASSSTNYPTFTHKVARNQLRKSSKDNSYLFYHHTNSKGENKLYLAHMAKKQRHGWSTVKHYEVSDALKTALDTQLRENKAMQFSPKGKTKQVILQNSAIVS